MGLLFPWLGFSLGVGMYCEHVLFLPNFFLSIFSVSLFYFFIFKQGSYWTGYLSFVLATLPKVLVSLRSFLVEPLGLRVHNVVCKQDTWILPFLFTWYYFLGCFITLARTSGTMLNRSAESGYLALFLVLVEVFEFAFIQWQLCVYHTQPLYTAFPPLLVSPGFLSWSNVGFWKGLFLDGDISRKLSCFLLPTFCLLFLLPCIL